MTDDSCMWNWSQSVVHGSAIAIWSRDFAVAVTDAELETIALPRELVGAHPRRQLSFRAGRLCAAQALRRCGFAGDWVIARDPDGLPLWPNGVAGSISHTVQTNVDKQMVVAAALVAAGENFLGIGLDCEPVMSDQRAQAVGTQLALDSEYRLLAELLRTESRSPVSVTLLFSAKEAIFKAVFPSVRRMFGFKSYVLVGGMAAPDALEGCLEFAVQAADVSSVAKDFEPVFKLIRVHFRLEQKLCWTLCSVARSA